MLDLMAAIQGLCKILSLLWCFSLLLHSSLIISSIGSFFPFYNVVCRWYQLRSGVSFGHFEFFDKIVATFLAYALTASQTHLQDLFKFRASFCVLEWIG